MDATTTELEDSKCRYELRFISLFHCGRGFSFDCSEDGTVDQTALSPAANKNYQLVQASVGREYATPAVIKLSR